MRKRLSHDKQRIVSKGSDDASDNAAIATIIDGNENNASKDNMNEGNIIFNSLFIFEIMHFTDVSFQLGHINEEGHNDTNIPNTGG